MLRTGVSLNRKIKAQPIISIDSDGRHCSDWCMYLIDNRQPNACLLFNRKLAIDNGCEDYIRCDECIKATEKEFIKLDTWDCASITGE